MELNSMKRETRGNSDADIMNYLLQYDPPFSKRAWSPDMLADDPDVSKKSSDPKFQRILR